MKWLLLFVFLIVSSLAAQDQKIDERWLYITKFVPLRRLDDVHGLGKVIEFHKTHPIPPP